MRNLSAYKWLPQQLTSRLSLALAGLVLLATAGVAQAQTLPLAPASARAAVPEASGYSVLYQLDIPNAANFNSTGVPYGINNSAVVMANPARVAYYLELTNGASTTYVWTSMANFATTLTQLGIPNPSTNNVSLHQNVSSLNVFSNVAGVTTGNNLGTGRIEMWPSNYATNNADGVPGASDGTYDFGDQPNANGNYGSFQVHNVTAGQTVLAYNNWGSNGGNSDLGIGNQATNQPDWTFVNNAGIYSVKRITILVNTPANNALAFDGVNDYVHGTSTLPATGEFTLEGWVNPTAYGGSFNAFVMSDNFPAGAMHAQFEGSNGYGMEFTVNGNVPTDVHTSLKPVLGQWSHIAVVYSASAKTVKFYLNGTLFTSASYTTAGSVAALPYSLGGWLNGATPDRLFNGKFDEVRIYNAALTPAQVQADMFSTASALPANLKAYYNFDQGTAGGNNASQTTLADQSGNGNTGTLTNFALTGTTSNFVRSFPTITGISPTSGQISSSVTFAGTNLLDATGFKFNGTAVSPFTTPTSDLSATVTVHSGTTTGPVSVSSAALTAYNGPTFTVLNTTAITWTGAVSTNWATADNWNPAVVPTGSTDATISSGPNQPVVSGIQIARNLLVPSGTNLTLAATTAATTELTLGSLTLATGSTLTQGAASELYITGNMTNNGATFALNATSEVGFGFAPANHILNGTTGVTFQILTVGEQGFADNLSLQVPVQVRRKLGVYNSSTTSLDTGGSLTLLSDATGTALVENGISSTVTGPVTVQRYIDPTTNAGLGYRHYSAPVSNTTVADLATAGFAPEVSQAAAYNASATPGTTTPFPTVFAYDQSRVALANAFAPFDRGFAVPASLSTPLAVGKGYAVNLTGAQLVDFVGVLNNGDLPVSLARNAAGSANDASAGWQLVGNPYPSPLDWSLVLPADRPGLDAAVYVYESASAYAGAYRANVNGVGGNANSGSPLIASGQGFFVRVSSGQTSASLTFRNAQRVTVPTATTFRRTAADPRPLVQLELRGTTGPADALYAYAETGASPAFDAAFDAAKLPNTTGLNLASMATTGESLAVDGRPAFTAATVLPLTVGVPAAGSYSLTAATLANLPAGLDAFLNDAATGQTVNLSRQPSYAFAVSAAQVATAMSTRFVLRFAAAAPLATAPALTAADITLYPNPARDQFTVLVPATAGAALVQGTLLNALGQTVRQQTAPATAAGARLVFDTADLAPGVYTLRLHAGNATLAKRVVIQ